jgi:zinc protease
MLKRNTFMVTLLTFVWFSAFAHGLTQRFIKEKAYDYRLKNGLTLVVIPDHRSPVVMSQIWYHVGSADESDQHTGLSHLLEHMMFKGTEKTKAGVFSKTVEEEGGRLNAFTSQDFTAYHEHIPVSKLELILKLEADRMHNLQFDQKAYASEKKVVKEERRSRVEDNPFARGMEQFNWLSNGVNPYRNPTIGWMESIDKLSFHETKSWYKRFYQPNNATLILLGDLDPAATYQLVKKIFSKIPSHRIKRSKIFTANSPGSRRLEMVLDVKVPELIMGYNVPVAKTAMLSWNPYALDVLSAVLGLGNDAYLLKSLRDEKHIVSSIGVSYSPYMRYDDVFTFYAVPAGGNSLDQVEDGIESILSSLKNDLLDQASLQRAKTQIISQAIYDRDDPFIRAYIIGSLESNGLSWKTYNTYFDKIKAVTAEQIRSVAKRYFVQERKATTMLLPEKTKE